MRSVLRFYQSSRARLGSHLSKLGHSGRSGIQMIKPLRFEPLESRVVLDARVMISELVASNDHGLRDDDSDRSDWVELFNSGDLAAHLEGWYLTDDANDLQKWRFPDVTLDPGQFLVVFASGKDRTEPLRPLHTNFRLDVDGEYLSLVEPDGMTVAFEYSPSYPALAADVAFGITQSSIENVALSPGAAATAWVPTAENGGDQLGTTWTEIDFDDNDWPSGTTGVGFERFDVGFADLLGIDLMNQMFEVNASAFIRIPLTVENPSQVHTLTLRMKYDDGFVAYINGVAVASRNAPELLTFDAMATATHSNSDAVVFEEINISSAIHHLQVGDNVLAIHALNRTSDDPDLLILPELRVGLPGEISSAMGRVIAKPTPGSPNGEVTYDGLTSGVSLSQERGFYDDPIDVTLSSRTVGATIVYTTDGSVPSFDNGIQVPSATADSSPLVTINLADPTVLRVAALKEGFLTTRIQTHTYMFVDKVRAQDFQATLDAGFPPEWGTPGLGPDYGLDSNMIGPNDLFEGKFASRLEDSLTAVPSISIVTDFDNLFGPDGILDNPTRKGINWERPTSVELIHPDGTPGFQIDAGIRVQGDASRQDSNALKKSFRFTFRRQYGEPTLEYPLFGPGAASEFNTIRLRANYNDGSVHTPRSTQQIRDEWMRRTLLEMGRPNAHGTFMHVYVNGFYWGVYNVVERPDAAFSETYFGGDKENWDAISASDAIDGTLQAWSELRRLTSAVRQAENQEQSNAAYQTVLGNHPDGRNNPELETYLDVDNYIDYLIANFYGGNNDWPGRNYIASRERGADSSGFKFFSWDAEKVLGHEEGANVSANELNANSDVAQFYADLRTNDEFRLRFADRVHEHFANGGSLYVDPDHPDWDPDHPERNVPAARYAELAALIELPLVAELARWGDTDRRPEDTLPGGVHRLITPDDWAAFRDGLYANYFPRRSAIVWDQLRTAGLYSSVGAARFQINGQNQHGGLIVAGDTLSMSAVASVVTTDSTLVSIDSPVKAFAPTDDSLETGDGPRWFDADFDADGWTTGTGGVGFGNSYEELIGVNVQDAWNAAGETSLYTRYEFELDADFNATDVERLTFQTKFDDGYAVYVNGQRVAGSNAPSPAEWNSRATGRRQNFLNTIPSVVETKDISDALSFLRPGTNVLAVHVLNHATDLVDILIRPELILSDDAEVLAPIVYTLDGTDPREFGGASVGVAYDGPISLTETTVVSARTVFNGQWSALNRATFVVNPVGVDDLVVSEINYNPAPPTVAELSVVGTLDNDDFEFIEVLNRGGSTINLIGAKFTNGVDFEFPAYDLAAGERAVIVRDAEAFGLRYGNDVSIIGEFADGRLSNGGERLRLADAEGTTVLDFEYHDNEPWTARADGAGATLELIDPATDVTRLGKYYSWRGSTDFGGSPGAVGSEPIGVVVNEVLTNTDGLPNQSDAIELLNTTTAPIDLSGWFLSDSAGNLKKFQIPDDTVLGSGEYLVFDESQFNPNPANPGENDFALSGVNGDDVWLVVPGENGGVLSIVDDVHFGAAANGEALGRVPNGTGRLAPLGRVTLGATNAAPRVGPLVVSEVHYQPAAPSPEALAIDPSLSVDDLEFVELHNPTQDDVDLTEWRLRGGIDLEFDSGTTLSPGGTLVVLSFNPANPANAARLDAFRTQYGLNETIAIQGGYGGQLRDNGERVQLQRGMQPPLQPTVAHLYEDELIYDNVAPWGASAAGGGDSLQRRAPAFFGGTSSSWSAGPPTPGNVDFRGNTIGDLNADGEVTASDINVLQNAVQANTNVLYYDLNDDSSVDAGDVNFLVQDILGTFLGDTQLDGRVDPADLNRVGMHWLRANIAGWEQGDFTGDGRVDVNDLNLLATNWQQGVPIAADDVWNRRMPRAPLAVGTDASSGPLTDFVFAQVDHNSLTVSESNPPGTTWLDQLAR